jgi:hypothetical protein
VQRDRHGLASFLLPNVNYTVADVLAPHADNVRSPLSSMEQERQAESRFCADWVPVFELDDLLLRPCVKSRRAMFEGLKTRSRIVGPHACVDGQRHHRLYEP